MKSDTLKKEVNLNLYSVAIEFYKVYVTGNVSIYIDYSNPTKNTLVIKADGKVILEEVPVESGWLTAAVPSGTHQLEIGIKEEAGFLTHWGVKIEQKGRPAATVVVHDLYCGVYDCEMPTIQVNNDGTVKNVDSPQKVLNSEYLQKECLQKFID